MTNVNIHRSAKIESKTIELAKKDTLNKLFKKHKVQVFHDQNPKEEVEKFQDVLNSISYSVIKPPNSLWEIKYKYKSSEGNTKVQLLNKFKPKRPTLIFHHGLSSIRPILELKILANTIFYKKFNLFMIKASHHEKITQVINKYVNNFNNFATNTAASVIAVNEIVNFHKSQSKKPTVVTGFSLGGIITSLHYFFYNSSDYYFPIIAFPNLGEIILDENNKEFVHNYDLLKKNKSIRVSFKIPKELQDKPRNKIFPILAESDELVRFEKARKFWKDYEVKTLNVGHFSIFVKRKEIREHILSKVDY